MVGTADAESVIKGDQVIKLEFPPTAEQKDPLTVAMYKYAKENLALVNIYIKDPAVTQIKREQKIPLIRFVANVGGILGLTMGCSLVTGKQTCKGLHSRSAHSWIALRFEERGGICTPFLLERKSIGSAAPIFHSFFHSTSYAIFRKTGLL